MLGVMTNDYNEALEILNTVKSNKVFKHSEDVSYIYGSQKVIYLYSNDDERDVHEVNMIAKGWRKFKSQNCVSIYLDLHNGKSLRVPCGIYEKSIFSWKNK